MSWTPITDGNLASTKEHVSIWMDSSSRWALPDHMEHIGFVLLCQQKDLCSSGLVLSNLLNAKITIQFLQEDRDYHQYSV